MVISLICFVSSTQEGSKLGAFQFHEFVAGHRSFLEVVPQLLLHLWSMLVGWRQYVVLPLAALAVQSSLVLRLPLARPKMSLQQHLLDKLLEPRLLQQELPHTVGLGQQEQQPVLWVDWDSRRKD
jgi:hypothetical protein